MSGIGTRSRSLGRARPNQPQIAAQVPRAARKVKNIPPNIDQENMAFLAIPVRNNDPEEPGAGEFPAFIGPQEINHLAEPAAAVEENSQNILPKGDLGENIDDNVINNDGPAIELRSLPSAGNLSRMYSDEDIKAIVRAAMMDAMDSPSQSGHTIEQHITGS